MLPSKILGASLVYHSNVTLSIRHASSAVLATAKGSKVDLKSIEDKIDLPKKPKKPPTPWIMFARERKDEHLRNNPGSTIARITQIISKEWKDADRSAYVNNYNNLNEVYKQDVAKYEQDLKPQHLEYIKLKKELQRQHNAYKELKAINRPPRCSRNAAALYAKRLLATPEFQELKKSMKMAQVFQEVFRRYKDISDSEREELKALEIQDQKRFDEELEEWYTTILADPSIRKAVREQADTYYKRFKRNN